MKENNNKIFMFGNNMFYWLVQNVPFPDTFYTIVHTVQTNVQNPLQKQTIYSTFCSLCKMLNNLSAVAVDFASIFVWKWNILP
jgi:hypothetical protein